MRTMKQLCDEALAVQSASNLSGIVHSFSRAMTDLRALMEADSKAGKPFSTDDLNRHPVAVLYSDKIVSLTYSQSNFSSAYNFCADQVESAGTDTGTRIDTES